MVVAFPLGKLIYLGVKQISKPVANYVRNNAKRSPFLRKYICIPPAQAFHRLEVFVKMRLMGAMGPTQVEPLKEDRAVEVGADIIGEAFIYFIAAGYIVFEYYRSVKKEQNREESQNLEMKELRRKVDNMDLEMRGMRLRLKGIEQQKLNTQKSS